MRKFSLILLMSWLLAAMPFAAQAAAPIAADNTITIDEDSTYTFSTAEFGFSDSDDDSFVSIQIIAVETVGALELNGSDVSDNQTIDVSDLPNLTFVPALDASGSGYDSFQFTVNDGTENSSPPNTITFDVLPVDDPPYFSSAPTTTVDEDSSYDFTPAINDVDSSFSPLIFTIENQPGWITTFDADTGQLIGTPDNSHVGVHSNIIISVEDVNGLVTPLPAFNITVNNTNDAPTISGTPSPTVNEDTRYTFTPSVVDVDLSDTKRFSITNRPIWASFNINNGTLSGTPTNAHVGTHAGIAISVTDSGGESDTLTLFEIEVLAIDDLPYFNTPPITTVDEDDIYNFTPDIHDDDSSFSPLVYIFTIENQPSWIAPINTNTGQLTGTPNNSHVGVHSNIIISVEDENGLVTALPAFSITVNNTNDPVTISGTPDTSVNEDTRYLFTPTISDDDNALLDKKVFSIVGRPTWASFNEDNGTLSGTPTNDDLGTHASITISVTDSGGTSDTLTAFDIDVINVNDAPTFTNHPTTTINEDSPYQFTLTATDVDSDVANLEFSITPGTSLPDWLTLPSGTRILSSKTGRPNNEDVGTYNNLSFTVTDNDGASTSLPPFSITVVNTNDAPTGGITITGTHEENSTLGIDNTLSDEDDLGVFRYQWQRNGINVGSSDSYLLGDADVGQTISVIVSYTDRRGTDESIEATAGSITGVNDDPVGSVIITGLPHIGVTLTAENTLSDADGLGDFTYEWARSGTVILDEIGSSYTLVAADENQTLTVTISYPDGQGTNESITSAPSSPITVAPTLEPDSDGDGMSDAFETTHGLNPAVDDANDDLDGDGISNYQEFLNGTDPAPPEGFMPPANDSINATGLLTEVALGSAITNDGQDGVIIAQPDNSGPFLPGRHTITWTATDAAGNSTTASATQTIDVVPMVNFSLDQINEKGTAARVTVHLNGDSPSYSYSPPEAVRVYFTVSGSTSKTVDHNLDDGFIDITSGATGSIDFNLTNMGTGGETITLTMGALTNAVAGDKTSHTITITEQNSPPKVSLTMSQNDGPHTSTVVAVVAVTTPPTEPPDVNKVVVTANIVPDMTTDMKLDWSRSDNALVGSEIDIINNTFTFEPAGLNIGTYSIVVDVREIIGVDENDNEITKVITTQKHRFKVLVNVPVEGQNNYQDSDGDGIANYLDKIPASYAVALQQENQSQHIVETQPGLTLRLGAIAFESGTNGIQVSETAIERYATTIRIPKDDHQNIGGLFDFEIHGLSQAGDSALVVIPLRKVIPANPRYRKLMPTGWQDFTIDEKNSLASAPGEKGICPPPNDSAYTSGLTNGHHCIQLRLEDGGPNDTDGTADGVITDPGGVAIEPIANERPPPDEVTPLPAIGGGILNASYLLFILAWLLFFNHRRYKWG